MAAATSAPGVGIIAPDDTMADVWLDKFRPRLPMCGHVHALPLSRRLEPAALVLYI